jgi:hypothetical protein
MTQRWTLARTWAPVAAAVFLVAGCDSATERPAIQAVTCEVTVNGKPLTHGRILFLPDRSAGTNGRLSHGEIINGKVTGLTCYKDGDGAVVGSHKVEIHVSDRGGDPIAEKAAEDMSGAKIRERVPEKYNRNTELRAKVRAGESKHFKFELQIANFEAQLRNPG